jgi:hypothetical protein
MKRIQRRELFRHLSAFLESKGVELNEGSYVDRVRQGCDLLTDVVNGTQAAVRKTRDKVDDSLERLRARIHEMTAPPNPGPATARKKPGARKSAAAPSRSKAAKS